jgi:hypothetical protein
MLKNILARRPGGKVKLGRPRLIWEDNINMDLWEMWEGVDWM